MTEIVLHAEAFEEVLSAFIATGAVDPDDYSDVFTVGETTFRLWKYVPTEEEIARHKAFAESPLGIATAKMFAASNAHIERMAKELTSDMAFIDGHSWPIGTQLKIRLPNDYEAK